MDKIKPLLVHKFWILFGVALLLPVIGWKLETGSIAEETAKRKTAVETAFKEAKLPPGAPNDKYVARLTEVNQVLDRRFRESTRHLWETQQELMFWPADIARYMKDVPYRGRYMAPNSVTGKLQESVTPRQIYRTAYFRDVKKVRDHVEPFDLSDGSGKVDFPEEAMPQVNQEEWADLPPTWDRMWEEQEDLWLLMAIFDSIRRTNQDAPDIAKAPVRRISEVMLKGGDRSQLDQPAGGGMAGDMAGGPGGPGGPGASPAGGNFFSSGGRGSKGRSVGFDPSEEFGPDALASAADAGGPGGPGGPGGGPAGGMMADAAGPGGRLAGKKAGKRYVDEDENLPFRTRGFYLHVVIDHRRLPEFIANLSNMPWPTTILRVQQQSTNSTDGSASVMDVAGMGGPEPGGSGFGRQTGFGRPSRPGRPGPASPSPIRGPMDSGFAGGAGEGSASEIARRKLEAAMSDPYLTDVVIAGLMTIYKPPGEAEAGEDAAAGAAGASPDGGTPAAGEVADPAAVVDPADGTDPVGLPADPGAVVPEGTLPEGAVPADGAATPLPEGATPENPLPNNPETPGTEAPPGASNPAESPAPADSAVPENQP